MKNSYKIALLAALGLASVSAVQAQSDLIVGVYQTGYSDTTAVDIGAYSSLTTGETWDLTSELTSAGISSLSSSGVFGVVGDVKGSTAATKVVYATDAGTPGTYTGVAAFNADNVAIETLGTQGLGTQVAGSSSGVDWKSETDTTVSGGVAASLGYSMSGSIGSQLDLYSVADNGTEVLDGYFTLDASSDVLTYTASSVPEPTTYGLLAGAGLLIVSLRNKFSRKQA